MEPVILLVRPFLQLNQGGRVTCVVLTRQIHTFTHTHTHPHERRSQSTVFSCELEVTLALTQAIIALPATIFFLVASFALLILLMAVHSATSPPACRSCIMPVLPPIVQIWALEA